MTFCETLNLAMIRLQKADDTITSLLHGCRSICAGITSRLGAGFLSMNNKFPPRSAKSIMGVLKRKADILLKNSTRNPDNGCIEPNCCRNNGYGRVGVNGKNWTAHRIIWASVNGDIPRDKFVCHSCNNRACININHLRLDTPLGNNLDAVRCGSWRFGKMKAILTPETVKEIRTRYVPRKVTQYFLAKEFGVSQPSISLVINRKNWRHF